MSRYSYLHESVTLFLQDKFLEWLVSKGCAHPFKSFKIWITATNCSPSPGDLEQFTLPQTVIRGLGSISPLCPLLRISFPFKFWQFDS